MQSQHDSGSTTHLENCPCPRVFVGKRVETSSGFATSQRCDLPLCGRVGGDLNSRPLRPEACPSELWRSRTDVTAGGTDAPN